MGRASPLGIEGTGLSWRDEDEKGRPTCAMVRARDERGDWQSKRFAVTNWRRDGTPILPAAAMEWARETRKTFVREQAVARAATFQDFADLLAENLGAAGVSNGRIATIKAVSMGLEAEGIKDMRSDAFAVRVRKWLTSLKAGWSLPADAKNRRRVPTVLSNATRNTLLVICRQVTGLAVQMRRLPYDPLEMIPRFQESEHLKPLFTIAELRRMVSEEARMHTATERAELEAAITKRMAEDELTRRRAVKAIAADRDVHWTSLYNSLGRRAVPDPWWLACCLLVYTGARAQEAMALRWEWVNFEQRIITLKLADDYDNKTDKERLIPLEPELAAILFPIKRDIGHILPPEIRAGGSGVRKREESAKGDGAKDYSAALERYLGRIGMEIGDRSAHSLRHCYITMKMARADMNVERLRKAVGHADFSTTMGYGKLSRIMKQRSIVGPTQRCGCGET